MSQAASPPYTQESSPCPSPAVQYTPEPFGEDVLRLWSHVVDAEQASLGTNPTAEADAAGMPAEPEPKALADSAGTSAKPEPDASADAGKMVQTTSTDPVFDEIEEEVNDDTSGSAQCSNLEMGVNKASTKRVRIQEPDADSLASPAPKKGARGMKRAKTMAQEANPP